MSPHFTNLPAQAQQCLSSEAAWRRLSQLAAAAWDRGEPIAASWQSSRGTPDELGMKHRLGET
tara:strand:+ start:2561 stop:2749 length:189 start_codon:yes stop_codon:yes gene_type:complete